MYTFLWISLGAIVGANLRYWVAQQMTRWMGAGFAWGTLAVNLTGSFILGFFMVWATSRTGLDPRWRLLIAVGFCGGYTTFSSYAWETLAMAHNGEMLAALWNIAASNALALAGVALGAMLARGL